MIGMSGTALASLFLALLVLGGCDWFDEKKQPLPGERISVLSLDRQLEPDPDLSKIAITLPPPNELPRSSSGFRSTCHNRSPVAAS